MSRIRHTSFGRRLENASEAVTKFTGSSLAFTLAVAVILVWGCTGPLFHFSNTWQLVVNTGTTIVTFLMVFLIQRTQNKDALAVHLKLNELVASMEGASNRLIDVESLSERDLRALERHFGELARLARNDENPTDAHTVEEARRRHSAKSLRRSESRHRKPRAS
jgi:low affinity Fe/Cu permease